MSFLTAITRKMKNQEQNVRAAEGAAGCAAEDGKIRTTAAVQAAAHNREQQRVQAHQNAQRPASTYLTGGSTTRSQPYAANQQRNTVFQQRGNTRQGLPGTGSRSTQQNNLRQPASTYLTGGSVTRSQPYAASQQNQLFSARKAAEQRRNPRQNVSTATKSSGDGNPTLTQFLKNSMDWHKTSDPNRKAQLHAQNDALRRKLGYEYNPQTGASFDKYGHEMTAGVRMAYGSKPTERLNQATQLLHTSGVMGKTDKATVYPTPCRRHRDWMRTISAVRPATMHTRRCMTCLTARMRRGAARTRRAVTGHVRSFPMR